MTCSKYAFLVPVFAERPPAAARRGRRRPGRQRQVAHRRFGLRF